MGAVADFYRNVTLVKAKSGLYYPRFGYHGTRGYQSMRGEERGHFDYLVGKRAERQTRTGKPKAEN
jgi:hypothetical protein